MGKRGWVMWAGVLTVTVWFANFEIAGLRRENARLAVLADEEWALRMEMCERLAAIDRRDDARDALLADIDAVDPNDAEAVEALRVRALALWEESSRW